MNFSVATQRKKEEMQSRQLQLEKEREMLKHTKIEWGNKTLSHKNLQVKKEESLKYFFSAQVNAGKH